MPSIKYIWRVWLITIDTNRLAYAAEEIQRAIDKIPTEITIRFFRQTKLSHCRHQ